LTTKTNTNYEYDEDGRVTREDIDVNGDGIIDITKTFTYQNDLLIETTNSKQRTHEFLDYNSAGLITRRLTQDLEFGTSTVETFVYEGDLLTQFQYDKDGDGNSDKIVHYSYNNQGKLLSTEADLDGDGTIDSVTTNSYFSDGKHATYSEDKNNDGVPNLLIAYTYDIDGNRKLFNVRVNENALPTETSLFSYTGKYVKEYMVLDSEYRLKFKESYSYDSQGRRKSFRKDTNGDGTVDVVGQYKHDQQGNRTLAVEDRNGDGRADKIWKRNLNKVSLYQPWDKIFKQL
jgi:hypothetical protein